MGLEKLAKSETAAKKKRRGSTNNKNRLAAFSKAKGEGHADWGGCDSRKLQDTIEAITSMGGAITLGLSRDLGAHSLTLLLDGSRETLWFNGDANLDSELDGIIETLRAIDQ